MLAAADFTDPGNARVILMAAGGLVALAVLLALGTVWWWRTSKVEHPALGPLEVMSGRRWASARPGEQEERLASARGSDATSEPAGAPSTRSVAVDDAERDPLPTDAEVEVERDLDHYDSWSEPAAGPVLFDQDDHDDPSGAPNAPGAPGAPLDPLLAPRRPQ